VNVPSWTDQTIPSPRPGEEGGEVSKLIAEIRSRDRSAWAAAVSQSLLPPPALVLALSREARNQLFISPTEARRWMDLAEDALARARRASSRPEERDLAWLDARVIVGWAACDMVQGHLQSAHERYSAALEIYRRLGDEIAEARTVRGLQFSLTQMGRQQEAICLALPALAVFRRWKMRGEALGLMNNLGLVYLSMGRHQRTERIFTLLIRTIRPEDELFLLVSHNAILASMVQDRIEEALRALTSHQAACRAARNHLEEGQGELLTAECLILRRMPREALDALGRARPLLEAEGSRFDLAFASICQARCRAELNDPSSAMPPLRAAADFFAAEGYVTPLRGLLDLWMAALSAEPPEASPTDAPWAEKAFLQARYFWKRLPPPGASVPGIS